MRASSHAAAASATLLLLLAACSDSGHAPFTVEPDPVASESRGSAQQNIPTRQEERAGTFLDMADTDLWEHILYADRQAIVGLKAPGARRGTYRGQLLIDPMQLSQARQSIMNHPGVRVTAVDELLPILEVRFESAEALRSLRRRPMVDYIEPFLALGDMDAPASIGGCGWPGAWSGETLVTGPSGDRYSERFAAMRIPDAWQVSVGGHRVSGRGITVGLTDTGISNSQWELRGGFAGGTVGDRTVRHFFLSSFSSADDACGHGTRMAGVIAAPDDGQGIMGVAWGANLVNVRHADGVANISTSAARASIRGAANANSRIITMAWQSMNWWWSVSDEIRWWHRNRDVLFIGAAGTSGCGDLIPDNNVIFPAEMGEVVAVTGIRYPEGGIPCGIHYGRQVELTAFLDVPATGRFTGDVTSIGGSSNATAIVSGIAALAWQGNPGMTRDQLRQRLQASGAFYPTRSSTQGFGLVNAHRAVTGF